MPTPNNPGQFGCSPVSTTGPSVAMVVQMIPGSRTWPTAEAYADLGNWPAMTKYTVHQTCGPTSFYWGYLVARE